MINRLFLQIFHCVRLVPLVCILIVMVSCDKHALFDSGDTVSQSVSLQEFNVVEIEDIFEIELVSDTINKLEIITGSNLINNISHVIKDEVLYLYDENTFRWTRKYAKTKLVLHAKDIEIIHIREPSDISTRGIYTGDALRFIGWSMVNRLDLNVDLNHVSINMGKSNSGEYSVKGKVFNCHISAWGTSFVDTRELESEEVIVRQRSRGDVFVNVGRSLRVSIEAPGNVYYFGDPEHKDITISGTGKLIPLNP